MKDRAGESLKKARKLNFSNKSQRVKEFIGSNDDTTDIFRFKARSSAIAITAKGLSRKEDLTLYQVNQRLGKTLKKIGKREFEALRPKQQQKFLTAIDLTASGGRKTKSYSTEVEDGVYFVVISSRSKQSGRYTLKFSASPIEPSETDGDRVDDGIADGNSSGGNTGVVDNGSGNSENAWARQLGSSANDYGYGIAVDASGNVYVAGTTAGDLSRSNGGSQDNFVTKYDATGNVIWSRQFDFDPTQSTNTDTIFDIEVDRDGNYYVVGATANIPDSFSLTNISDYDSDGVVAKYNSDGEQLWQQIVEIGSDTESYNLGFLLGTVDVHKFDLASSLAIAPDGSVYVAGFVEAIPKVTAPLVDIGGNPSQGFIAKFDGSTGTRAWLTPVGGSGSDTIADIAIDDTGNLYITGLQSATTTTVDISSNDLSDVLAEPFLGGDAFVAKYQDNGNSTTLLWEQSLASTDNQQDYSRAIALDSSNNVYITGETAGSLPGHTSAGDRDGFVAQYDTNGAFQWSQQFGTAAAENSQAIAIDSTGKIYLAGETTGSLYGSNVGSDDIWIATYDTSGSLTGSNQFGTTDAEEIYQATVDSNNNVYFVGQTFGDLAGVGANQGLSDGITLKNPTV